MFRSLHRVPNVSRSDARTSVMDLFGQHNPKKLFFKYVQIFFCDPYRFANFIGGHLLRPDSSVYRFGIDLEDLRDFGDCEKLAYNIWLELDAPISRNRTGMLRLAGPYLFRDPGRKRGTPSPVRTQKVLAAITHRDLFPESALHGVNPAPGWNIVSWNLFLMELIS